MEKDDGMLPPLSIEASDATASDVKIEPEIDNLSLTIPTSPTSRHKNDTSPRSPKRSPTKQHVNLLNIDPAATLAAISARLALVVRPAESEITRINREALAAVTARALHTKTLGDYPLGPKSPGARQDGTDRQTVSNSTRSSSPSLKGGMIPAFYDSVIAEEWVNVHLETCGAFLLPANDVVAATTNDNELDFDLEAFAFRKAGDGGPLGRAGMDRYSLYRMGMPKELVDRLYRALYVYTNGFHNLLNDIAAHCPPRVERHVSSNAWLTFLLLLEQCDNGKYEMAMLQFKRAAQDAQTQLQESFQHEKRDLSAQLHLTRSALVDETTRGAEKSELIRKLVTDTTDSNLKIAEQQQQVAAQAEQIRLLKLEILVHEDEEKKLNEFVDEARRDYEVANSERLNALSERFALDEEIRRLSSQMARTEAEKTNYARRMHETMFMNEALRTSNDQLKQELVVQGMDKDKYLSDKQSLQQQVDRAQDDLVRLQELKAQVDKELVENQRQQSHLEARFETMKEQLDIEVDKRAKHQHDRVQLLAQIDEHKVQVGVLEAKCNLLTAEKPNTGMRAQDKLRIERLLNQKLELEALVETAKLDRKRDEEQIYTLRSSLESLDTELQHHKRVYSAGQQAFLHSERTCEQLRQHTLELEKNYEKAKKNVASLKERFKMYEVTSKEQLTKLEVEVKVTTAQLREITYVNKDNVAQMDQLTKSLSQSEKDAIILQTRLEESEKQVVELQTEKEDLQRNKTALDLATSTSKHALNRFVLSVQNMLALVKLDEFPLDEALRELLQMVQDTFGEDLTLDNVLDEDDKPEEIELEVDEDVTDEERASRQRRAAARRKGIISIEELDEDEDDDIAKEEWRTTAAASQTSEVVRMSRFRKNKLDHLVNKLQREIALKAEFITNLENAVLDQTRQISQLMTTTRQQTHVITQYDCQKSMFQSDLETTTLQLVHVREEKQAVEFTLEQVRIDQVLQTNRAFQAEVALATLRREFDMHVIVYEDLVGKIWREFEHDLYMRSLRRHKEVQATVTVSDQPSQTLVPQRNPAMERPRVASQYIPSDGSGSSETLLEKVSRATRELLPGVASEMELQFTMDKPKRGPKPYHHKHSLVRPLASSPRTSRTQLRAQASHDEGRRRRYPAKHHSNASTTWEAGAACTLPLLDESTEPLSSHMIHHVNEFGTRQNVLVSPTRPPFFIENHSSRSVTSIARSPRPPAPQSPRARNSKPRQLSMDKRLPFNHLQLDTQYEERVESVESNARYSTFPRPTLRQSSPPSNTVSSSTLRYSRSFLRTGMEVLRNTSSSENPLPYPDEEDDESASSIEESDSEEYDEHVLRPSRLVAAVSGYNRDQLSLQEAAWRAVAQLSGRTDSGQTSNKQDDAGTQIDEELVTQNQHSPFTPAVLYPILPDQ